MANCLDDVAEGIDSGSFEPTYAGCVEDVLGGNDGSGFRELSAAGLRVPVMDLLREYEGSFQTQIDMAQAAGSEDRRQAALTTYQLLLGQAALELRALAE